MPMTIIQNLRAAVIAPAAGVIFAGASFAAEFETPVEYHKLDNGLKVVLSEDHTVPTTTVGVYYGIGFRIEPRDRTGFAHLFEHMMFQGSENLGKAEFINLVNSNGGVLNGSTRFDFTNYFEVIPSHKTETFIWAEADRMRGLKITQDNLTNQQGVVKNEVKVNVLNQPYGGFPWLDLPQLANENWHNAHNFYGDLEDLDAATLEDVQKFFNDFYAPNNAVLVVAGDIDPEQTLSWVEEYFGDIPASDNLSFPDISEPRQEEEKRLEKTDALAPRPAIAWAYHVPERGTPEWYAMLVIDAMLTNGDDSRLHQRMVQEKGFASNVPGGVNWPLGNAYNYNGPMIWSAFLIHDDQHSPETITAELDAIVDDLQTNLVSEEEMNRAMTKIRSDLYDRIGDGNRIGLVDTLAVFALFDDNPERINGLEEEFDVVTPELIRETAQEYLRSTNRSVITLKPGAEQ
ncbi:M16 family metallopeptidase [Hyphococcus sp.]|uniref:M16 family metallopeptidase n=1 Tax=Hyphococcus sp. TaxID=2038636 RepID=UPI003CCC0779